MAEKMKDPRLSNPKDFNTIDRVQSQPSRLTEPEDVYQILPNNTLQSTHGATRSNSRHKTEKRLLPRTLAFTSSTLSATLHAGHSLHYAPPSYLGFAKAKRRTLNSQKTTKEASYSQLASDQP